jgi:hypothetical protein
LDLVPKVTLLGHVVPHVMITLDHVWSQGLKTSVFEFAGTKYKQKNLQGLKPKISFNSTKWYLIHSSKNYPLILTPNTKVASYVVLKLHIESVFGVYHQCT